MADRRDGVWVARYDDRSAIVAYLTELEALREAVERRMVVAFIKYGDDLFGDDDT